MPEVYNSTTVEFQTRRPTYASSTLKYGLPILAVVSIGIGGIVFLTSLLAPEHPPSWIPFIFGLVIIAIGIGLILFWKFWERKGRGFTVLKPRIKEYPETGEPIVQAQEEEFMNQEGVKNELVEEIVERNSLPSSNSSSKSLTPMPTTEREDIPEQSHYKLRHFASHGYGKKPARMAPLARAEDVTPSLRSSYSSLAYVQEFGSESSISIDSTLFHDLKN